MPTTLRSSSEEFSDGLDPNKFVDPPTLRFIRGLGLNVPDNLTVDEFRAIDPIIQEATKLDRQVSLREQRARQTAPLERQEPELRQLSAQDINLRAPIDFEAAGRATAQRGRSQFRRGLEAGFLSTRASLPGIEALARGIAGDEVGAETAAGRAGALLERAAEIGPDSTFQDVIEGRAGFLNYAAGMVGTQVPVLASIIGTSIVTSPVGGAIAKSSQVAVNQAVQRKVRAEILRATNVQKFRQGAAQRAPSPETVSQAAAATAKLDKVQTDSLALLQAVKQRGERAVAVGQARGGALGAVAAGTPLYSAEGSQILFDEESDASLQQKALAGFSGAGMAAIASMVPTVAVLRNVGLGRQAAHLTAEALQRRGRLVTVGIGGAKQAALEAPAETTAQFFMAAAHRLVNDNIELFSNEALWNYAEAGVAGGLIGLGLGSGSSIRLRAPGATEAQMLQRQADQESKRKQKRFENLPEQEREQRSLPLELRMDGAVTGALGKMALENHPRAAEILKELPENIRKERTEDIGFALRVLLDPDAPTDITVPRRGDTPEETISLPVAARELLESVFGNDTAAVLEAAHVQLIMAERNFVEQVKQLPDTEQNRATIARHTERVRLMEEEFNHEPVVGETPVETTEEAQIESPEIERQRLAEEQTSEQEVETTQRGIEEVDISQNPELDVDLSFQVLRAGRDFQAGTTQISSPEFGGIFVSARARSQAKLAESERSRTAEKHAARLNEETGEDTHSVAPLGDSAIRHFRSKFGLPDSETAARSPEVQEAIINEAKRVNEQTRLNENKLDVLNRENETEFRAAIEFLNQFDAVVREAPPDSLTGRDTNVLTTQDLKPEPRPKKGEPERKTKSIVESLPRSGKPSRAQVKMFNADGKAVGINLISLTQKMLGRTELAARERSKEARRRAGERAQQEGTVTGEVSAENLARALRAGLAEMMRHGFTFEETAQTTEQTAPATSIDRVLAKMDPNTTVFITSDKRRFTLGQVLRADPKLAEASRQLAELEKQDTTGAARTARKAAQRRPGEKRKEQLDRLKKERETLRRRFKRLTDKRDKLTRVFGKDFAKRPSEQQLKGIIQRVKLKLNELRKTETTTERDTTELQQRIEAGEEILRILEAPPEKQQAALDKLKAQIKITEAEGRAVTLIRQLAEQKVRIARAEKLDRIDRTSAVLREFGKDPTTFASDWAGEHIIDVPGNVESMFGEIIEVPDHARKQAIPDWISREEIASGMHVLPTFEQRINETKALNALADRLGLGIEYEVIDWVEAQERSKGRDISRDDGLIFAEIDQATGRITARVWVNELFGEGDRRLGALLHEFGHAIVDAAAFRASDTEIAAIWKAYEKWVAKQEGLTVDEAVKNRRSFLNIIQYREGDVRKLETLSKAERKYVLSFHEWFADQVARWVENKAVIEAANKKTSSKSAVLDTVAKREFVGMPEGVVQRFFFNVAAQVREFIDTLKKYLPSSEVSNFLDRLWSNQEFGQDPVRTFHMWTRLEKKSEILQGKLTSELRDVVKQINAEVNEDSRAFFETVEHTRAQERLAEGAIIATELPFSIQSFYATRDLLVAKLTPEERRVLAQAFNSIPVRRRINKLMDDAGFDAVGLSDNALNHISVGYQLWQAGLLELGPTASKTFSTLHSFIHKVAGMVTNAKQADQIMRAIGEDVIESRRSDLFERAKKGTHLSKGKYALEAAQLRRIAELADGKLQALPVDKIEAILNGERHFATLRKAARKMLAEDIKNKFLSEKAINELATRNDFTLNPHKQFVVEKIISDLPLQRAAQGVATFFSLMSGSAFGKAIIGESSRARISRNAAIIALQNDLLTDVTSEGRREGMINRKSRRLGAFNNQYLSIVDKLTETQQKEFGDEINGKRKAESAEVKQAVKEFRQLMTRAFNYAREAGLEMGFAGRDYVPLVFDPIKVEKISEQLVTDWMQNHFADSWNALARRHGVIEKSATMSESQRKAYIRAWIDRIITMNEGLADVSEPVLMEHNAPAPFVRALNKRELNFLFEDGNTQTVQRLNSVRNDNINEIASIYLSQLVKRVEYVRTFGSNNGRFQARIDEAKNLGATEEDIQFMRNMMHSAMGTVGLEVSPFWKAVFKPFNELTGKDLTADPKKFRQLQGAMVVYQNFRILAMATLTNIADVAGIFVRTGDIQTAFEAYKLGLREVMHAWTHRKLSPAEKRLRRSELAKLAEEMGIVEASIISDVLGQFYGGNFFSGTARRWNNWFFRINGMEMLTRTTRMMALAAGRRFIINHAQRALKGDKKSLELLAEIDLRPEDVKLTQNGELDFLNVDQIDGLVGSTAVTPAGARELAVNDRDFAALQEKAKTSETSRRQLERQRALREVARDDRVKQALFRMVDESVLRPAALQRPTWMNDPNWQIFSHLKGFMYTYHERPLRRAYSRAVQGNYGPLMMLPSYVALMMTTDLLRELFQHGPDGDDRKREWTFGDRVIDGTHRSGLYGAFGYIPDMMKTQSFGRNPFVELGGPTVSQVNQLQRSFLTGRGNRQVAMKRSVPASQVLVDPPTWIGNYLFDGVIDEDSAAGRVARARMLSTFPLVNPRLRDDLNKLIGN